MKTFSISKSIKSPLILIIEHMANIWISKFSPTIKCKTLLNKNWNIGL